MLAKERRTMDQEKIVKTLLLGSGDSGKTTMLKQLKINHGGGFSLKERQEYLAQLIENIVDCFCSVLIGCAKIGIVIPDQDNELAKKYIQFAQEHKAKRTPATVLPIPAETVLIMETLWKSPMVQLGWQKRSSMMIQDTADYFLESFSRYLAPKYIVTDDDILRIRKSTTSVTETVFFIRRQPVRVYDVGGQISYRKAWIPFFDDAKFILFITALSQYDQTLEEDPTINRMNDAIKLFHDLVEHPLLANASVMLFLNKKDLFEKKLTSVQINTFFPEFTDKNNDLKSGVKFFKRLFWKCKTGTRTVHTHITTATDSTNMKTIISAVAYPIVMLDTPLLPRGQRKLE